MIDLRTVSQRHLHDYLHHTIVPALAQGVPVADVLSVMDDIAAELREISAFIGVAQHLAKRTTGESHVQPQ